MRVARLLGYVASEAPFRVITRAIIRRFPCSMRTKAHFDAVDRPQYLFGLLAAVDEAKSEGIDAICAIEFGVAAGKGLLELQSYAQRIAREERIRIEVFG